MQRAPTAIGVAVAVAFPDGFVKERVETSLTTRLEIPGASVFLGIEVLAHDHVDPPMRCVGEMLPGLYGRSCASKPWAWQTAVGGCMVGSPLARHNGLSS